MMFCYQKVTCFLIQVYLGLSVAAASNNPGGTVSENVEPFECLSDDSIPPGIAGAPFLVFGEVHGTQEVPRFVISYLCATTKNMKKITLAMEIPVSEQRGIDDFLASRGDAEAIDVFLSDPFWRRDMQDGRTSIAMLRFFEKLRLMRANGAQVRVVAIDNTEAAAQREVAMSSRLRTELERGGTEQVVALIGGLHAIRSKGTRFNPSYESAIFLLTDWHPLSLTVGTAGGTAWVCKTNRRESCLATPWDINRADAPSGGPLSLNPPSEQFDGVFFVGRTTASSPAVDAPDEARTAAPRSVKVCAKLKEPSLHC